MKRAQICFLLISFSFFFLKAKGNGNAQLRESLNINPKAVLHRSKRATITESEAYESVFVHNRCRAGEGSSDMESLSWNGRLADMAQGWADTCQWSHGQTINASSAGLSYMYVGQNLYAVSGAPSLNITSAIYEWYIEKQWFDYDTLQCQASRLCGHYTQVVWATSYEIGCAYKVCSTLKGSSLTNAILFVCNYGPAGNYGGQKPYQKGTACSKCSSGKLWCTQMGLCNRTCTLNLGPNCPCAARCVNGNVDYNSCSCKCWDGWTGVDCSMECKNYDANCDPRPGQYGWPPELCKDNAIADPAIIRQRCPAMCKQCVPVSSAANCLITAAPSFELLLYLSMILCTGLLSILGRML